MKSKKNMFHFNNENENIQNTLKNTSATTETIFKPEYSNYYDTDTLNANMVSKNKKSIAIRQKPLSLDFN